MSQAMQSSLLTLTVLEHVSVHQPVRVAEVAEALGKPKSTVQRALVTLREAGWIRPDGSEWTRWVLTPACSTSPAAPPTSTVCTTRRTHRSTRSVGSHGESGILAVRDESDWVVVDYLEGLRPVQVRVQIGRRFPLHAGAAGKAILAFLPSVGDRRAARLRAPRVHRAHDHVARAPA